MNVMIHSRNEGVKIAPAEVKSRIVGLRVDRPIGAYLSIQRCEQRTAVILLRDSESIDQRGKDIDELDRRGDAFPVLFRLRQLQHQGNLQILAIQQDPVLVFAMLAEPFAMIRKEHDGGAVVDALLAKKIEETSDHRVCRGNVSVVGSSVLRAKWLGRIVRRVGL